MNVQRFVTTTTSINVSLNLVFQVQSERQAISVPATARIDPRDLRT